MRVKASFLSFAALCACIALFIFFPNQSEETPLGSDVNRALRNTLFESCDRIDFHVHFDPGSSELARGLMDRFNLSCAVNLTGMPAGPLLQPFLELEDALQGRLITFAGIDWRLMHQPQFGTLMAKNLRAAIEQGARGLKIPKALGLMIPAPEGGLLPIDDDRLDPVFEMAAQLGVPVAIHAADPVAFWQPVEPSNPRYDELKLNPDWSYFAQPVPSHGELMAQQRRLFKKHPKTTFIAVHVAGFSENLDWVQQTLSGAPNVMIDVAARIPELGRQPSASLREFFLRNDRRILFGTDLGVGPEYVMLGAPLPWPIEKKDVVRFFESTWRFFESSDTNFPHPTPIQGNWTIDGINLPQSSLKQIYRNNALRVLSRFQGHSAQE